MTADEQDFLRRGISLGMSTAALIAEKHKSLIEAVNAIRSEERSRFKGLWYDGYGKEVPTAAAKDLGIGQMQPGDLGYKYLP